MGQDQVVDLKAMQDRIHPLHGLKVMLGLIDTYGVGALP